MEAIQITVTGAHAQVQQKPLLTCGMVGVPVEFTFDESWEGLKKTAVFRAGMATLDVVDVENACTVPHELLVTPYRTLRVGVYGTNPDGSLVIPTVWAEAGQLLPGADPAGDVSTDPTLPVWQQIQGDMVKSVNGSKPDENGNVEIPVGITKILLWENASKSSSFVPQNIVVATMGVFHEIEVEFGVNVQTIGITGDFRVRAAVSVDKMQIGKHFPNGVAMCYLGSYIGTRTFRRIDSGNVVEIFEGKVGSSTNNYVLVPYRIYGIKGVSV